MTTPVIVLNSVAMKDRALCTIREMQVSLYLDRDKSGRELTERFKKALSGLAVKDKSDLYAFYEDFNAWLKQHQLPVGSHASIPDTSELMYLGGEGFVRQDRLVAGRPDNGIVGDPRPSSPELGKRVFDMKVDYGVEEIRRLVASPR